MSANLKRAVLVAEDSAFFDHEGFDFEQIRASIEVNLERFELSRGASTDHATAGQESVPLAVEESGAQVPRVAHHAAARGGAHEAPDSRALSEHGRVGRRHLRRRSRSPHVLRCASRIGVNGTGGAARGLAHQPACLQPGRAAATAARATAADSRPDATEICSGSATIASGSAPGVRRTVTHASSSARRRNARERRRRRGNLSRTSIKPIRKNLHVRAIRADVW